MKNCLTPLSSLLWFIALFQLTAVLQNDGNMDHEVWRETGFGEYQLARNHFNHCTSWGLSTISCVFSSSSVDLDWSTGRSVEVLSVLRQLLNHPETADLAEENAPPETILCKLWWHELNDIKVYPWNTSRSEKKIFEGSFPSY